MKSLNLTFIIVLTLLVGGALLPARAQDSSDIGSSLTIPWDEFKKLIDLDNNLIVISMDTFRKLIAQTGIEMTPLQTLKNGDVVLTREQFNKLVDQMKPPSLTGPPPPFAYLITKASYTGEMRESSTNFEAVFVVHVLQRGAYVKVPILPSGTALADIRVGSEPALVIIENGYHNVVLPEPGEYTVTARYSVKSSLDKGPHQIDLAIAQTPITLLSLTMPLTEIDIEIPQAQQVLTQPTDQGTKVSAVIGQGQGISVRWRKMVTAADKIPAKLYAEIHHMISIQDDVLKTQSAVTYTILHSEVDGVRLVIPEDVNLLSVTGEGVGEWQEMTQDNQRVLTIPFTYGKKGTATVYVTTEKALSESGLANAFAGFRALDTVRETGFIGIELATSAEVIARESDGLEAIAVQKLPRPLINRSARPLMMGFKYLKHPFSLVFDIKKHDKVAVPVATINSASVVTLFTEDGKMVHRLVYQVRNNAKQFIEIQLPEKTDVWSVLVGNQPVESSVNGNGKLLVPLNRSQSVNNTLNTFPVEVIYCTVQKGFSPFGTRESVLPTVDILVSQLIWSVYLPNDFAYMYFQSTLEKEEIIRGVNVLTQAPRRYDRKAMRALGAGQYHSRISSSDKLVDAYSGNEAQSEFRNFPMEEDESMQQIKNELEFSGRIEGLAHAVELPAGSVQMATGVLPVHIRVPTGGQVYRFARTIIQPSDPLSFSVVYTRQWVISLLKWFLVALIAMIVYWNRRRLMRIIRLAVARANTAAGWIRDNESVLGRYAQSIATPIILIGLVVIFSNISIRMALLFFLLFVVSVFYHLVRFSKKRLQMRTASKEPAGETNATS
jgi:hypothetical protein